MHNITSTMNTFTQHSPRLQLRSPHRSTLARKHRQHVWDHCIINPPWHQKYAMKKHPGMINESRESCHILKMHMGKLLTVSYTCSSWGGYVLASQLLATAIYKVTSQYSEPWCDQTVAHQQPNNFYPISWQQGNPWMESNLHQCIMHEIINSSINIIKIMYCTM